ncbi:MAG: hypothetical protein ACKOCT_01000, partial [Alphaproteobacteria bacterium]
MRRSGPLALACAALAGLVLVATPPWAASPPAAPARTGAASVEPRVTAVSPGGIVKSPAQVAMAFSTPMIALGDPRAGAPAAVSCEPGAAGRGRGRWVDSRHWVFDFDKALPGGVRCRVALASGTRDLAGTEVATLPPAEFSTGGPAIVSSQPSEGSTIAEEQAFALELDAAATPASIEANAWLVASGIPEKIPVSVADDATRDTVLAAIRSEGAWWNPEGPVVVLVPRRRLPPEATVQLAWGAGIATADGLATTQPSKLEFTVRPPLRGEIHCQRENARSGCVPITPISLAFTEPVEAGAASRIALVAADGTRFPMEAPEDDEPFVSRVVFRGPFPPGAGLHLEIPAELRDRADREVANRDELRQLPVAVDAMPPLAKFAARFGMLESRGEPALPVTIRGLEPDLRVRLRTLASGTGSAAASGAAASGGTTPGDGKAAGGSLASGSKAGDALVRGRVRRLPSSQPTAILRGLLDVAWARRDASIFGDAPAGELSTVSLPQPDGA